MFSYFCITLANDTIFHMSRISQFSGYSSLRQVCPESNNNLISERDFICLRLELLLSNSIDIMAQEASTRQKEGIWALLLILLQLHFATWK